MLTSLVKDIFDDYSRRCFFDEAFGMVCEDQGGLIPGAAGEDAEAYFRRKVRKDLWPININYTHYTEDDLFDVIEFLYDHVSQPVQGDFHSFYNHVHYKVFNKVLGQSEFRKEINELLADYHDGFELSQKGEILSLADVGMKTLSDAPLPSYDPENAEARVERAKNKYLLYKSSVDDRRDSVRELADVLEFLRPKLKAVLTKKDESDLFELANRFAIRHHDGDQKKDYDRAIWLSWMYYYYLATIHAAIRLIEQKTSKTT